MNTRIRITGFCLLLSFILYGCDEGKIYPKEQEEQTGGKATIRTVLKNQAAWPEEYMLIFGAFGEEEQLPLISKVIPRPQDESDPVSVTLNGLDERVKTVSIAVVNKGRERLYSYYTYTLNNITEETVLPVGEIDLAVYDRIQKQVFNNYCIRCHGAGDRAAANLYLTEGKSYHSLVNAEADLSTAGKMFVSPGYPKQSFLLDILQKNVVKYNHTDVLPEEELITLIETWIRNGAKE